MTPLAPGEIRARRRPFVVLCLALGRLLGGLCLAMPLASLVSESGIGQRWEGDRALFEGGGYLLLEVLRLHGAAVLAAARGLVPVLLLGLLLTSLGNAALLVALNTEGRLRWPSWSAAALERLPALGALAVATTLAQGLLVFAAALLSSGLPDPLARPQQATALQAALWLAALLLAGALGGFGDVAKAALVRHDSGLRGALERALQAVRTRPFFCLLGWVPFAVPLVASALGAAWLTGVLDVARPGAWRVAVVFMVHQGVILVAVACRAAWFAAALRGVCAMREPKPW
jgi:hypothetical protein